MTGLRPHCLCQRLPRRYGSPSAGVGSPEFAVKLDALESAVDHRLQFVEILYFTAFGQTSLRFLRSEPGRLAITLIRLAHLMHFHQKCLDHEFLHSSGLPENALRVNVKMEMTRLDGADRTGFFRCFALGRLAVR